MRLILDIQGDIRAMMKAELEAAERAVIEGVDHLGSVGIDHCCGANGGAAGWIELLADGVCQRSEEHTSELQSR